LVSADSAIKNIFSDDAAANRSSFVAIQRGCGDMNYNSNFVEIPLLFDDGYSGLEGTPRTTFSYIGGIAHAHAFDEFVEFMKYALQKNMGIRFLVASRHEFPWDGTLEHYRDSITVRCGRALSIQEINQSYAQSICIWNLYRISTQSGVMANALMCGTPVLASRTGAFPQFIRDGQNGKFSELGDQPGIAKAFFEIAASVDQYSRNCRATFMKCFYYRSQLGVLERCLADLEA
jgi:glycosyltransferase involved in cell wall biosynthesis